jgi:hypothetical protein
MTTPDLRKSMKVAEALMRVLHLVLSAILIFAIAYILGERMLSGPLQGNDSRLHVGYATWLNQYFPKVPHWYPLQGGGESLLHGYPVLSHWIVVALHRLSGLSILQVFRLMSFLAFPLTAIGIYLFCWMSLRKQTVGLIAGVFYLLAPVTWTWMHDWGFFPQQMALIFLPLSLLAFDRALENQLHYRTRGRGRIWLAVLVTLVLLASLLHLMVGASIAIGMFFYVLFAWVAVRDSNRSARLKCALKISVLSAITVGLIAAIYLVPFYSYGQVANREGLNTPPVHQLHRLPIREFFGVRPIDPENILTRMQFPLVVSSFSALGFLFSFFGTRSKPFEDQKPKVFALIVLTGTIFTLTPALVAIVLRLSPTLFNFVNFRSMLLLVMVMMPILAAYGAWSFPHAIFSFGRKDESPKELSHVWNLRVNAFRYPATLLFSVLLAGMGIWYIGRVSARAPSTLPYGPKNLGVVLGDLWRLDEEEGASLAEQLAPRRWPSFTLSDHDLFIENSMRAASILPEKRPLRIDISPHHGDIAMDLATYANASQINSYTYQITLIHAMWGYQQNVFFSRETGVAEYGNIRTLNNNAKLFGIEYVYLNAELDRFEMYEGAGWVREYKDHALELWRYPDATGMATLTTKPVVLVIGKPETDAYMTIFRFANDGMFPYEEALFVEGQPYVDRYTVEELAQFDMLFLYGYDYGKSQKAWSTLAAYVEGGGNLFIDTGWEFWIPEWEFERAPDVLPVARLEWMDYGGTGDYLLENAEIAGEIDVGKFKPLIWEGKPWTLSGTERGDVRDWGQVVLSASGKPLIVAGEYGQGRVVWAGMNLISHARYLGDNEEELQLAHNLLGWLVERDRGSDLSTPVLSREHPDQVGFQLQVTPGETAWLYWREGFYPNWRATTVDEAGEHEVSVYRSGPGFMLMPITSQSANVLLELAWQPPFREKSALVLTVFGVILLIGHIVDGLLLGGQGFTWIKLALTVRLPKPILDARHHDKDPELPRKQIITPSKEDDIREPLASTAKMRSHAPAAPEQAADGTTTQIEVPEDLHADRERVSLLQEWLDDQEHDDDTWVEKMLGRKKKQ